MNTILKYKFHILGLTILAGIGYFAFVYKVSQDPNMVSSKIIYRADNLGFSFAYSDPNIKVGSYPDDPEHIFVVLPDTTASSSDHNAIVVAAVQNNPSFSPLDWLKGPNSGYKLSRGYQERMIGNQLAYLLYFDKPNQIDSALFDNPSHTRQITVSLSGDYTNKALLNEFNNILDSFSWNHDYLRCPSDYATPQEHTDAVAHFIKDEQTINPKLTDADIPQITNDYLRELIAIGCPASDNSQ